MRNSHRQFYERGRRPIHLQDVVMQTANTCQWPSAGRSLIYHEAKMSQKGVIKSIEQALDYVHMLIPCLSLFIHVIKIYIGKGCCYS